nr:immunoglobulin light chain junction region [Macaca mulatta]MOV80449.1 immunoglobulin light chain junction region [Macaca mulatta]MOV82090.1 immunoglobulin light chain junction region [Macaca mulatta]
CQQHNFYPPTF